MGNKRNSVRRRSRSRRRQKSFVESDFDNTPIIKDSGDSTPPDTPTEKDEFEMVSSGERTTSSETSITHNNGNLHEYASFNPYYWKDQDSSMSESERHYDPASTVKEAPLWPSGLTYPPSDFQKTLCQRLLHIGPLSAIFIILTIGLMTAVVHANWWPITTLGGCVDLLIFLTWNYLVLSNMLNAAFIGGGYVPLKWAPPCAKHESRLQYCNRCMGYKAPRSHHCVKCNRCVMKMDHHCPWINNCVGHRNQVLFIRFLFFAVVGCLHAFIILSFSIWNAFGLTPNFPFSSIYMFLGAIFAASLSIGVVLAVGFLLVIQLKNVYNNKTGIEQYICAKADYRCGGSFTFPYDLGKKRNILEVFNHNNTFPRGNGIWWPVRVDCSQFTLSEEQLAQKRAKQEYARLHSNVEFVEDQRWWKRTSRVVWDTTCGRFI